MQTVNFQCGHCGKLMAVGRENLGQQVRCPHCQQVVLAPSSEAPAPEPEPAAEEAPAPKPKRAKKTEEAAPEPAAEAPEPPAENTETEEAK